MTIGERLAEHVVTVRFADLPQEVVDKAKDHFGYHLALALGGHSWESGRLGVRFARSLSDGNGRSTIVGAALTTMPLDAIFANAALASMGQMDDTVEPSGVHPGVVIFPAAWVIAEQHHATGRDLIAAVVAGYDMARLGDPVADLTNYARRPQYALAPFCVAATVGRLLGLERERMAHAIGHAAHSGMGVVEGTEFGWQLNGLLARAGTTAALVAEAGGPTALRTIEGDHGFYRAFYGAVPDGLDGCLDTLGAEYTLMEATTKPFSASGANIPAMTAAHELRTSGASTADEIEAVRVVLSEERRGRDQYFEGQVDRPDATPDHATGSLRFRIAAIMLDGRIDTTRASAFRAPDVQAMMARVELVYEAGHTIRCGRRQVPSTVYGRVEVTTSDGRVLTAERERPTAPNGTWRGLLPPAAEQLLSVTAIERIAELVDNLEHVDDMACLMSATRPRTEKP